MKSKRVIIHFDGDAFFASVEQAGNFRLRGKPVVTGSERGIAASFSYEAKALGVHRGMRISDIRKLFPQVIVVESDYEMYAIYARRMYDIVRRFTPIVEEYSIDECFADITHLQSKPYADIALDIKKELEMRLGITFGVGVAPNKVLAKVASKHKKPAGLTVIDTTNIHSFIHELPIHKVWGIGGSMSMYFKNIGIQTAGELAEKSTDWLRDNHIAKPYREIRYELQGGFVKELATKGREKIGSIVKSRTFYPPTKEKDVLLSQLSKNVEAACENARYHNVKSGAITFFLKTQEFRYKSLEIDLPIPTASSTEIIKIISAFFDKVFKPGLLYRATGITLRQIVSEDGVTYDLFGTSKENAKSEKVFETVDILNRKFGEKTLYLGSSYTALKSARTTIKKGTMKRRLNIPFLGVAGC